MKKDALRNELKSMKGGKKYFKSDDKLKITELRKLKVKTKKAIVILRNKNAKHGLTKKEAVKLARLVTLEKRLDFEINTNG